MTPSPSHLLHAPTGLLKENILGSSSAIEYPHWEQAKLVEKLRVFSSASNIFMSIKPLLNLAVVSIESANRCIFSSVFLMTNLSTTTEILCFFCLSNKGNSSIG